VHEQERSGYGVYPSSADAGLGDYTRGESCKMKTPRESRRKSPKGLFSRATQLTNWEAVIFASTIDDVGRTVVAVRVTYSNDQCDLLNLTVREFRSLSWVEDLHIDAITYASADSDRRLIVEAIQVQGVPELMGSDEFDSAWAHVADKLCEEGRLRVI
jgi:hypothetical protein